MSNRRSVNATMVLLDESSSWAIMATAVGSRSERKGPVLNDDDDDPLYLFKV